MAVSNDFLEYMIDQLSAFGEVTARKMFGGAGLYRDGKMFCLVAEDVAYLKVDDTNRGKYEEVGSGPFSPYPDKPGMMSYFEIPPDVLENPEELTVWAEESLLIQKKKK